MFNKSTLLSAINKGLSATLGQNINAEWLRNVTGGDINQAALIRHGQTQWFVKFNHNAPRHMFETESQALQEISEQGCIRVPSPIAHGVDGNISWLVLEYLELTPRGPAALFGEQLAALHRVSQGQFGWSRNNYIGSTPQNNSLSDSWTTFWRENRLKPQLQMAFEAGHGSRLFDKGERLLECVPLFMEGREPAASLLHGDLWAGNKAFTTAAEPVIFDPASYYGDRETDIAMTELFGGFEASFYSAYEAHYPLADGYSLRRDLYNLYHMLNHLNLFGSRYHSRCVSIIDHLMAQVR